MNETPQDPDEFWIDFGHGPPGWVPKVYFTRPDGTKEELSPLRVEGRRRWFAPMDGLGSVTMTWEEPEA